MLRFFPSEKGKGDQENRLKHSKTCIDLSLKNNPFQRSLASDTKEVISSSDLFWKTYFVLSPD